MSLIVEQVFLTNGVGVGLASGLTYTASQYHFEQWSPTFQFYHCHMPGLAIPGHYFRKRRPLALGIVSSGSALGMSLTFSLIPWFNSQSAARFIGAFVHPIMLNRLINGHVGFHNAVKISASFNVFLLVVAGCLMRTRLPPKKLQRFPVIEWLKEPGYLAFVLRSFAASWIPELNGSHPTSNL
jgi:hypothetical protein